MNSLAASPVVSVAAFVITQFGSEFIIAAVGVIVYISSRNNRRLGIGIVIGIVISDAALLLVKSSYFRGRPYEVLSNVNLPFGADEGSSFPSGHTTRAFTLATLFTLFKGRRYLFAIIAAGLVGLSRVIIGVHFPLDVLGGAVFGITLAFITVLLLEPIQKVVSRVF